MANYTLNINLLKIDGAQLQTNAEGRSAVIIPVDTADIYLSEKNGFKSAYLGINMYESTNPKYDESHSLKLKFRKETIDRIGVEAIKNKPFIGNAKEKLPYGQTAPAQPQSAPQNNQNDYAF